MQSPAWDSQLTLITLILAQVRLNQASEMQLESALSSVLEGIMYLTTDVFLNLGGYNPARSTLSSGNYKN
eukprot:scaffold12444_cov121-Skeletonema_dohrnii-CCMP3373.AAC.1